MIPIEIVKALDLHCNDDGVLCRVVAGTLVPYGILVDHEDDFNFEPLPESGSALVSDDDSLRDYSRDEIQAMDWREQKSLCLSLGFLDKPQDLTWEQYLLKEMNL